MNMRTSVVNRTCPGNLVWLCAVGRHPSHESRCASAAAEAEAEAQSQPLATRPATQPDEASRAWPELGSSVLESGFNTAGVLRARDYDAIVPAAWQSQSLLPGARSALVLACGGRDFGEAFDASPEARDGRADPVDRFTERIVSGAILRRRDPHVAARAVYYWEQQDGGFADFVALGRACGMGSPSRLGILVHPQYGPWISIRAVILTQAALSVTPALQTPGPCDDCPAPCAAACPGAALASRDFDVSACVRTTLSRETCRLRCDARRACVVGSEHAYTSSTERLFRSSVVRMLSGARR